MELLEQRIRRDGIVKDGDVLKVDSFINHQIDAPLLDELACEFQRLFGDLPITKVLTIEASGIADQFADTEIDARFTIGQIVDMAAENGDVQAQRDQKITVRTTVGKLMDLVGEGRVKTFLADKAAEVSYVEDYEYSQENVVSYWLHLLLFVVGFAALATITLEFIDKDKRL